MMCDGELYMGASLSLPVSSDWEMYSLEIIRKPILAGSGALSAKASTKVT